MPDPIEQSIAELREDIEALRKQMKRLARSDRAQTRKLKWQLRTSLFLLGIAAVGAMTLFSTISIEDRAFLERVAIGVLTAGVTGAVGVNFSGFEPPSKDDDEDES